MTLTLVEYAYITDTAGWGTTAGDTITLNGNTAGNFIDLTGQAATFVVDGDAGADTIKGGDASDTITLGAGADTVVFNSLTGTDTVTDYVVVDDSIQLSLAAFAGLAGTGALTAAEFVSGAGLTDGQDADDRIVYDETSGSLYYDADGNGAGAAILIGIFNGAPVLTVGEFTVVA